MNADDWQQLEVRHLLTLDAIAEHGSFGQAALALGYSPSAVSQQVAAMERIVGVSLFERLGGRRAVRLTPQGELLLRHAQVMMDRVRAAQADLRALEAGPRGPLTVGIYQSVGARLLPDLLTEFSRCCPGVEVRLREAANDAEAWGMVSAGEVDVTFSMLPLDDDAVGAVEVLADPYMLLVPAGSALADADTTLTRQDIAAQPLVAFRTCRHVSRVEAQLRQAGCEPNIVFRSDDNSTIQALVASGYGIALMPRLAVDLADPLVRARDVGALFQPRLLGVCWHRERHRSPAVDAFIELAERCCEPTAARHAETQHDRAEPVLVAG